LGPGYGGRRVTDESRCGQMVLGFVGAVYTGIYSAYAAYTVHRQSIQCIYKPQVCIQSIYSAYTVHVDVYRTIYSHIQSMYNPYSPYTSPEAPCSLYTVRIQSIYMHTEHIYSHTQSAYSPYSSYTAA
jgi:hypothetical protein